MREGSWDDAGAGNVPPQDSHLSLRRLWALQGRQWLRTTSTGGSVSTARRVLG